MNYYEHHLGDFARDAGYLSMLREGAYRRLIDVYYATEKPLPLKPDDLYDVSRCTCRAEREAVDYVVAKFFKRGPDGWHQKRCDEQIAAYLDGEPERLQKRENDKERKRRSRERRSGLFEQLREHGITPSFDSTIAHLETLLSRVTKQNGHTNGHVTGHKKVTPVTVDGTASHSQSPSPNPQSPIPTLSESGGGGGIVEFGTGPGKKRFRTADEIEAAELARAGQ